MTNQHVDEDETKHTQTDGQASLDRVRTAKTNVHRTTRYEYDSRNVPASLPDHRSNVAALQYAREAHLGDQYQYNSREQRIERANQPSADAA